MNKTIDLEGLSEEQARLVQEFVEFLRTKALKPPTLPPQGTPAAEFRSWPLGVKGSLTREEIYDHL